MQNRIRLILFALFICINGFSQTANDSIKTDSIPANEKTEVSPLPKSYPLTQRLFWSENGVMRQIPYFKLNEQNRERELALRRNMILAHRYAGYATLAGMVAQGFVGAGLYSGNSNLKDAHEALAAGVNITYFTTAGLALLAPPRKKDRAKGFSAAKLHKYLAVVHISSMIATNILADKLEDNGNALWPYHRAAAYTAFGSLLLSMVVINF